MNQNQKIFLKMNKILKILYIIIKITVHKIDILNIIYISLI
jgi:hypothetical protein